jgi:hypothetical protein
VACVVGDLNAGDHRCADQGADGIGHSRACRIKAGAARFRNRLQHRRRAPSLVFQNTSSSSTSSVWFIPIRRRRSHLARALGDLMAAMHPC